MQIRRNIYSLSNFYILQKTLIIFNQYFTNDFDFKDIKKKNRKILAIYDLVFLISTKIDYIFNIINYIFIIDVSLSNL